MKQKVKRRTGRAPSSAVMRSNWVSVLSASVSDSPVQRNDLGPEGALSRRR